MAAKAELLPVDAPECLDTRTPQMRNQMGMATTETIEIVRRNNGAADAAHRRLDRNKVTLEAWADIIAEGLKADQFYIRMKAAQELRRFYETTGEQVQLIRAGLGLDDKGGATYNTQVNIHTSNPETARALDLACQDPRVEEAIRLVLTEMGEKE